MILSSLICQYSSVVGTNNIYSANRRPIRYLFFVVLLTGLEPSYSFYTSIEAMFGRRYWQKHRDKVLRTRTGMPVVTLTCRSASSHHQRPNQQQQQYFGAHQSCSSIRLPITSQSLRLFGTKRGVPGNPPGTVGIYNEQTVLPSIDEEALRRTIHKIGQLIGYETYDVTLLLVDDDEMRETNLESRGVDAPTDILSFPFHFAQRPGLLEEPEFDVPDYYTLGDMMVCVPYVIRRCQQDAQYYDNADNKEDAQFLEEKEFDDEAIANEDDRGVSGAMALIKDPELRIRMLLVHGMLHLVGYDHEEDDEYLAMVEREEEILQQLGEM
jgi:rRNA maturation RNase YbeY